LVGFGSKVLECSATYFTEKSLLKNEEAKHAKAKDTNTNCISAAGRASDCQTTLWRKVPASGTAPKNKAMTADSTNAN
jgi:hypothetical protein